MHESHRCLPVRYPRAKWLSVTWHLHGSASETPCPAPGKLSSGKACVAIDRYLDTSRQGPITRLLRASLYRGVELGHYDLGALAIEGNHIHVLLQPKVPLTQFLQSLKGATLRETSRLLKRAG
jgi:hypothetical protein